MNITKHGKILKSQQEDKELSDQNLGEGRIQRVSRVVMSLCPGAFTLLGNLSLVFLGLVGQVGQMDDSKCQRFSVRVNCK